MRKSLFLIALLALAVYAESMGLGPRGLSGWQGLPCSDVLPQGSLRLGAAVEYSNTDDGTILTVPIKGCWGAGENLEVAAVVPFVPVDDAWNGSFTGDITVAAGWLYEETRGGTTLKLTGRITLPTGEEYRDTGGELAVGGVTSTTFRNFRLSMSGEYALNGGKNPFDEKIKDVFYFTGGGTSYITPDLLLSGALSGSTSGFFQAAAAVQFIIDESFTADCGVSAGLEGNHNFGINAGVYWTGLGF